ncbi:hypothetical protein DIPPA_29019 [Diplonema papillatum]|nr:hypothetical protein DIPPA_29019 [Diplonema papillatum]
MEGQARLPKSVDGLDDATRARMVKCLRILQNISREPRAAAAPAKRGGAPGAGRKDATEIKAIASYANSVIHRHAPSSHQQLPAAGRVKLGKAKDQSSSSEADGDGVNECRQKPSRVHPPHDSVAAHTRVPTAPGGASLKYDVRAARPHQHSSPPRHQPHHRGDRPSADGYPRPAPQAMSPALLRKQQRAFYEEVLAFKERLHQQQDADQAPQLQQQQQQRATSLRRTLSRDPSPRYNSPGQVAVSISPQKPSTSKPRGSHTFLHAEHKAGAWQARGAAVNAHEAREQLPPLKQVPQEAARPSALPTREAPFDEFGRGHDARIHSPQYAETGAPHRVPLPRSASPHADGRSRPMPTVDFSAARRLYPPGDSADIAAFARQTNTGKLGSGSGQPGGTPRLHRVQERPDGYLNVRDQTPDGGDSARKRHFSAARRLYQAPDATPQPPPDTEAGEYREAGFYPRAPDSHRPSPQHIHNSHPHHHHHHHHHQHHHNPYQHEEYGSMPAYTYPPAPVQSPSAPGYYSASPLIRWPPTSLYPVPSPTTPGVHRPSPLTDGDTDAKPGHRSDDFRATAAAYHLLQHQQPAAASAPRSQQQMPAPLQPQVEHYEAKPPPPQPSGSTRPAAVFAQPAGERREATHDEASHGDRNLASATRFYVKKEDRWRKQVAAHWQTGFEALADALRAAMPSPSLFAADQQQRDAATAAVELPNEDDDEDDVAALPVLMAFNHPRQTPAKPAEDEEGAFVRAADPAEGNGGRHTMQTMQQTAGGAHRKAKQDAKRTSNEPGSSGGKAAAKAKQVVVACESEYRRRVTAAEASKRKGIERTLSASISTPVPVNSRIAESSAQEANSRLQFVSELESATRMRLQSVESDVRDQHRLLVAQATEVARSLVPNREIWNRATASISGLETASRGLVEQAESSCLSSLQYSGAAQKQCIAQGQRADLLALSDLATTERHARALLAHAEDTDRTELATQLLMSMNYARVFQSVEKAEHGERDAWVQAETSCRVWAAAWRESASSRKRETDPAKFEKILAYEKLQLLSEVVAESEVDARTVFMHAEHVGRRLLLEWQGEGLSALHRKLDAVASTASACEAILAADIRSRESNARHLVAAGEGSSRDYLRVVSAQQRSSIEACRWWLENGVTRLVNHELTARDILCNTEATCRVSLHDANHQSHAILRNVLDGSAVLSLRRAATSWLQSTVEHLTSLERDDRVLVEATETSARNGLVSLSLSEVCALERLFEASNSQMTLFHTVVTDSVSALALHESDARAVVEGEEAATRLPLLDALHETAASASRAATVRSFLGSTFGQYASWLVSEEDETRRLVEATEQASRGSVVDARRTGAEYCLQLFASVQTEEASLRAAVETGEVDVRTSLKDVERVMRDSLAHHRKQFSAAVAALSTQIDDEVARLALAEEKARADVVETETSLRHSLRQVSDARTTHAALHSTQQQKVAVDEQLSRVRETAAQARVDEARAWQESLLSLVWTFHLTYPWPDHHAHPAAAATRSEAGSSDQPPQRPRRDAAHRLGDTGPELHDATPVLAASQSRDPTPPSSAGDDDDFRKDEHRSPVSAPQPPVDFEGSSGSSIRSSRPSAAEEATVPNESVAVHHAHAASPASSESDGPKVESGQHGSALDEFCEQPSIEVDGTCESLLDEIYAETFSLVEEIQRAKRGKFASKRPENLHVAADIADNKDLLEASTSDGTCARDDSGDDDARAAERVELAGEEGSGRLAAAARQQVGRAEVEQAFGEGRREASRNAWQRLSRAVEADSANARSSVAAAEDAARDELHAASQRALSLARGLSQLLTDETQSRRDAAAEETAAFGSIAGTQRAERLRECTIAEEAAGRQAAVDAELSCRGGIVVGEQRSRDGSRRAEDERRERHEQAIDMVRRSESLARVELKADADDDLEALQSSQQAANKELASATAKTDESSRQPAPMPPRSSEVAPEAEVDVTAAQARLRKLEAVSEQLVDELLDEAVAEAADSSGSPVGSPQAAAFDDLPREGDPPPKLPDSKAFAATELLGFDTIDTHSPPNDDTIIEDDSDEYEFGSGTANSRAPDIAAGWHSGTQRAKLSEYLEAKVEAIVLGHSCSSRTLPRSSEEEHTAADGEEEEDEEEEEEESEPYHKLAADIVAEGVRRYAEIHGQPADDDMRTECSAFVKKWWGEYDSIKDDPSLAPAVEFKHWKEWWDDNPHEDRLARVIADDLLDEIVNDTAQWAAENVAR